MSAHCPFCKQPIPAELAQHGGNCPKCMLEIPGEDAPTDPGAHVRQKQEEAQRVADARQQRRSWAIWGVAATGLLGLAVFGAWKYQQHREAVTYDLDDYYVMPLEDIVVATEPSAPVAPVQVASAQGAPSGSGTRHASSPPPAVAASGTPPEGAAADGLARPSGGSSASDAVPADLAAALSSGGSVGLGGASIGVSRPDVVLSDPAEIRAMIGRVLSGSRPQLNACYQQRLKQVPDLRGTWDLSFTVSKDGVAGAIDAKGRGAGDRELEACMERSVAGWKFMKVASPAPVQVPFQFSAS